MSKVYSSATSLIPEIAAINDHDNVQITMTFSSGTIASIDLSRFANYGYDQRLEVFGAKGMLQAKNEFPDGKGKILTGPKLDKIMFSSSLQRGGDLRCSDVLFLPLPAL